MMAKLDDKLGTVAGYRLPPVPVDPAAILPPPVPSPAPDARGYLPIPAPLTAPVKKDSTK